MDANRQLNGNVFATYIKFVQYGIVQILDTVPIRQINAMKISSNIRILSTVMNEPKNMTETGIPSDLIKPFIKTIELSELMPKNAKLLNTFPFAFKDGHSFTLITNARNGTFVQIIIPHKSQRGWILAQRVTIANSDNKVLFEMVPDGFPKELIKW